MIIIYREAIHSPNLMSARERIVVLHALIYFLLPVGNYQGDDLIHLLAMLHPTWASELMRILWEC